MQPNKTGKGPGLAWWQRDLGTAKSLLAGQVQRLLRCAWGEEVPNRSKFRKIEVYKGSFLLKLVTSWNTSFADPTEKWVLQLVSDKIRDSCILSSWRSLQLLNFYRSSIAACAWNAVWKLCSMDEKTVWLGGRCFASSLSLSMPRHYYKYMI